MEKRTRNSRKEDAEGTEKDLLYSANSASFFPRFPRSLFFGHLRLRHQLFIGSALLSSLILLVAAWVINRQVVNQTRAQLQTEVETLLPVYDAVWNEYASRLGTLGATMASSPVVKTIFGDERAARDRATLHEMIKDFSAASSMPVDLFVFADGAGAISFAEMNGEPMSLDRLDAAGDVAENQQPHAGFALLGGRLFQIALTPVLLHSGNVDYRNTLAVIGAGVELDRELALALRERMHSEVLFLLGDRVYASSLAVAVEARAAGQILALGVEPGDAARPVELTVDGEPYLAFGRDLQGINGGQGTGGERIGRVIVLRSMSGAGQLFRAISNQLLLLWTLSIAAALVLSYLIANRVTRPVERLVAGVEQFGRGNYDYDVPAEGKGEIGALARAFDGMRHSLRTTQAALLRSERLATIGQMASSIIHDLRNPLATITTAAEVLGRDGLPVERRHALLDNQLRASHRMNEMLRELLEFSRGNYRLDLAPYDLAEIIAWAGQELHPMIDRYGIELHIDAPAGMSLYADGERLRRVIENLISNAAQAAPRGGRIEVQARILNNASSAAPRRVRVDVIDDGPGVPAELRDRIFEPFVSHGKSGGTGLGLAIARGLVEAHGGTIGLDETRTEGSDFYFILPLEDPTGSES
jgi:signal transduction histidine kinase